MDVTNKRWSINFEEIEKLEVGDSLRERCQVGPNWLEQITHKLWCYQLQQSRYVSMTMVEMIYSAIQIIRQFILTILYAARIRQLLSDFERKFFRILFLVTPNGMDMNSPLEMLGVDATQQAKFFLKSPIDNIVMSCCPMVDETLHHWVFEDIFNYYVMQYVQLSNQHRQM